MLRWSLVLLALLIVLPSHAVSLRDVRLQETLSAVAEASSEGTPRAINADITDLGFQAEERELINRLAVDADYAERMQEDPMLIRNQLQSSVCSNQRFRQLMDMGATLSYHFVLKDSEQPVLTQSFIANHCHSL
ncbi:PA3611 family quorum-sensing-regulated virulence factor [Halopseudomonas salegens]|uniref:Putative quorum-sensing-regulated virulence factor n=1 Tax=Halopseudomonas salegens TaxID=1434072 RepID=A0A1H2EN54_9GAMM|nr:PA3611 family quorum-sensing-regulated virulence factor [Halopseudomonas salegens]SDT96383.1 Putative quorum-sensing-regulated virulence factor [Halopseudomonas salegens]